MKKDLTVEGLLKYFVDSAEYLIPLTKQATYEYRRHPKYINFDDYFPSQVKRVASRLQRRGIVEIEENSNGTVVKITDRGKKEVLKYKWADFKPKSGKWDGLWRMVYFDIAEKERKRRDELRGFLKLLGMEQIQESVMVSPYDVGGEVKYLREILGIPNAVKLAVLKWIENEEELKEIFKL